ncbi:MAG: hypothetical protein M1823_005990 [Watsoniomyces obsoletus]|nr:MAG: hypothetical protein M1823_005990 [Watsoniomyces obsoletus]
MSHPTAGNIIQAPTWYGAILPNPNDSAADEWETIYSGEPDDDAEWEDIDHLETASGDTNWIIRRRDRGASSSFYYHQYVAADGTQAPKNSIWFNRLFLQNGVEAYLHEAENRHRRWYHQAHRAYFRHLRVWQQQQLAWEREVFELVVNSGRVEFPLTWSPLPYIYAGDLPSEPSTIDLDAEESGEQDDDEDSSGSDDSSNDGGGDNGDRPGPMGGSSDAASKQSGQNSRKRRKDEKNGQTKAHHQPDDDDSDSEPDPPPRAGRQNRGKPAQLPKRKRRQPPPRRTESRTNKHQPEPERSFQGPPPNMDAHTTGRIESWLHEVNPRAPDRTDAHLDVDPEDMVTPPGSQMDTDSTEGSTASEGLQNPPNTPSGDDDSERGTINDYFVEELERIRAPLDRIHDDQQNQEAIVRRNRARRRRMPEADQAIMNRMAIGLAKARGGVINIWTGRPRYPTNRRRDLETDGKDDEPIVPSKTKITNDLAHDNYAIAAQLEQTIAQARYYHRLERETGSGQTLPDAGPSSPGRRPTIDAQDQESYRTSMTPEMGTPMQGIASEELDMLLAVEQSLLEQEQGDIDVAQNHSRRKQPTVEEDNDPDDMYDE